MASKTETSASAASARETLTGYASRTQLVVVGITAAALLARFVSLGTRVAHQDEARVAYWAYRFMETGVYEYRPIVHGPFLTIVDGHLFGLFGASDFTMRLVVALIGGLLPLSALLFRERLRDSETVAMALLLAFNPILLYYSRFYRNDVLLAGLMLVAFGFFVRAYDHRRPAYLYAGVAAFALAFTTKENALVYPVTWAGAAVLLWDHRLFVERAGDRGLLTAVWARVRQTAVGVLNWWPHFTLVVFEFFAIVVFFYAPRGTDRLSGTDVPGLYEALANPTLLPAVVEHATLGSWNDFVGQWGGGNEGSYLSALKPLLSVLEAGAIVLLALAVLGFVVDRYVGERPSDAVSFTAYWGFASVLGYPVIVDNPFPWETIHMIVPLVVPAAVGLALIARLGFESVADGDALSATAAALILLLVVGQVGATAVSTSYLDSQSPDNELVQYAQSSSEMKPVLQEVRDVARSNDGIDVMYYGDDPNFDGDNFYAPDPSSHAVPPAGDGWFARLPFAWYMELYGAETDSVREPELLQGDDKPPVVIALGDANSCSKTYDNAEDIDEYMDGYRRYEVQRYLHDSGCVISSTVIYVDENATRE
ncbi:flippase activity-associated protein Agl23 [Halorussus sp. MSC15.2]|uniref:flippase activity-associated protein Agl23 n=1 Tax=Halorussus sp. MSC15.2 TaxID=2283638 RepID=UPI0013D384C4|nr:flippase activity-associated protein Agl23 [Halorussus sp. MSC15.2]NEU55491.1 TIGR03663 family protein [Halorussus sp. MSC15.2]